MDVIDDEQETMLTTMDNPFNPFIQFDEWKAFDEGKGYYTCAYLARIVKGSDELSDADLSNAIKIGIKEILSFNLLGNYCQITKDGTRIEAIL